MFRTITLFLLLTLITSNVPAQQPKYEMTTFQLLLLHKVEQNLIAGASQKNIDNEVASFMKSLRSSSSYIIDGAISDGEPLQHIIVMHADTLPTAVAFVSNHPAIKAGRLRLEPLNWWAGKNIMKPVSEPKSIREVFWGFLVKGDKWSPVRTAETDSLQAKHMAHLTKSGEDGKLVVAGPVAGSSTIRGILVYTVKTLEEARTIAEADPAVKAGRMNVVVYRWLIPEGSLPE